MLSKNVGVKGNALSLVEAASEENMLRILVKKYPFRALDYIPRDTIAEYFKSHGFSRGLVARAMKAEE